ncbi:hypothetical protein DLAC_08298 [Tieghemostelium lacteum]|uniref:Elp3/MiaA/NifB-like radical SAM core domain-containing protein n=1 Tax=Tieghemostelium lacteum TaxID=361077 RepID=A0A151ZBN3_TIELA|nr:hypothetical protein DLAC_08298 [Tieghemostelium lacteum]|eukprot:KYQ91349.1 hypothetical protein DLAC_08298 [Tieghemostelium lacteum]
MTLSMVKEIKSFKDRFHNDSDSVNVDLQRPINSIYFGGGTPSLAKIGTLVEIVQTIKNCYPNFNENQCEITLEVNPDQLQQGEEKFITLLKDFKRFVGVNRLSLGIQSLNDTDLQFLGRTHSSEQSVKSLHLSQTLFDRVSFDLIYARHSKQTVDQWREELTKALKLVNQAQGGHMSLYQLTIEQGTNFHKRINNLQMKSKNIIPPNDDLSTDLYEETQRVTSDLGFPQYEVSSFASSPHHQSRHNLNYWRGGDYIGIGPGACSRITLPSNPNSFTTKFQGRNILHPKDWMDKLKVSPLSLDPLESKDLSTQEIIQELLLMGLRTLEGVNLDTFNYFSNNQPISTFVNQKYLDQFLHDQLLTIENNNLKPTPKSLILIDQILNKLLIR